jgi:phenylpyruvate tautomerase PptA (4-oxalocrotonate tautomerase family)
MPILHVKALPQKDPSKVKTALKKTCLAIAEVYGCQPQHVWATWEEIQPGFYIEGENNPETQPAETHPPIAQLLCFEGKNPTEIEEVLTVAASTLSQYLELNGNVFITYHEARSGQVIAGDGIVRKKS